MLRGITRLVFYSKTLEELYDKRPPIYHTAISPDNILISAEAKRQGWEHDDDYEDHEHEEERAGVA
eukprot:764620-Hanusia_phi.AAC.2